MKALIDGLKTLGVARLVALGAVGLGMIGMLLVLALRGGGEQMALLYGDLDLRDSAQVVDVLKAQHVPFRLQAGGAQILVPADQVAQLRLVLAKDGLPTGGSVGYEIFDRGDGLGATEFQQKINETRALEGELARTIRAMQGVRAARVLLVLPRREPFARERQEAQASVMLTMTGAARLDREGVQAILNLVAAAVPGLRPKNIAIVDSRGEMLARAGEPTGIGAQALSTEELRHNTELRLSRAVEEMLERSLGPGRVRAEAAVRMNFDRVNETQERFDPDGQVARSTQTVNSSSRSTEANASVSVQNNLPNANAGGPTTGTQEGRQEETTNYEVSKTVRTLIREQPQIERISLAVMVDGTTAPGPDGKPEWRPRPAEELARIQTLVKTAIGFDEKRGDRVDVVSMRFADDAAQPEAKPATLLGLPVEHADLVRLGETAILGLVALVALLLVLRPMINRLTTLPDQMALAGGASMALLGAGEGAGGAALAGPAGAAVAALPAPAGAGASGAGAVPGLGGSGGAPSVPLLEDDTLVHVAQFEGQMRASSLRRISTLVERHPEEALGVVRNWLAQGHG
ncbi:MAG: flagellar M-ring protein FliF [Proteobacteria bacterium]|nr:flagellar M-ring protein FliF [Pseudomonadota bacterium]